MAGFDKDEFWVKILSMYETAKQNNYIVKLDQEQVEELKNLFIDTYIPPEKLVHYDDNEIMRKLMTGIVSIHKQDNDDRGNVGETIQLVNTVKYDGKNLYMQYARISPAKFRRFELGKTRKEISERMGYGISAVRNCESDICDLSRQPRMLVEKLASALECEPEDLF
jgi:hypothetical protein